MLYEVKIHAQYLYILIILMLMAISIITRAHKTSELKNLVSNINSSNEVEKEIIDVCNINDYNIEDTKIIIENSNRFRARITGIKNSSYEKILFLDSDQIPENGLLKELDDKNEDMIIIPERSINNSFTSKCLDDWRYKNDRLAKKNITPYIPVVPRFYKKEYLIKAVNRLHQNVYNIIDHEDSVLYYEAFIETNNVGFSKKYIYNYDPDFFNLMRKAFLYGKNERDIKSIEIPEDIKILINRLNKNTLNVKELGISKGYVMQILRGIIYEIGKIFG